ncbi:hypothetical protein N7523_006874 [Penicillium sp. IBT 18751x]|nr:hypothetical protein N7523_006874 [Penicillium sp. IBT 18751x]
MSPAAIHQSAVAYSGSSGGLSQRAPIPRNPPPVAPAPRRSSRPSSSGSPPSFAPPSTVERLEGPSLSWYNLSPDYLNHHQYPLSSLAPPLDQIPSAVAYSQSFDNLVQESELWADQDLSFADTDWNFLSIDNATPYPACDAVDPSGNDMGYGMASTFASLSDSGSSELNPVPSIHVAGSVNSQDGYSHASPVSQLHASVATSLSSPTTSQGDDVLGRVDSSRVEKRRLNTLAARRCRQRRLDRVKSLEDELEAMRKERDELRLRCSKLEGETEALKGLLTRKSN